MISRIQLRFSTGGQQFTWWRFRGQGFEIKQSDAGKVLAFGSPAPDREVYYPLETEGDPLMRFIGIQDSADVLAFAKKWGYLGLHLGPSPERNGPPSGGEFVSAWKAHAAALHQLVTLADAVRCGDRSTLRQFVEWGDGRAWGIQHGKRTAIGLPIGPEKLWKQGDLIGPARELLASEINRELRGRISLELRFNRDRELGLAYVPATLKDVLWLQMAEYVAGAIQFRRCDICGGLLNVTGHRSHKRVHETCSTRERMRRYRKGLRSGKESE